MTRLTVLVTGGAGFIGSHIVDQLVAEGCAVVVLDDLSSGRFGNIEMHVAMDHVRFVEGSILDDTAVARAMNDVDAVVHFAAIVSVPYSLAYPAETRQTNVAGTEALLDQCAAHGVEKFVYASSCAVYGEAAYTPIDETHPTKPLSPYAASKLAAEQLVLTRGGDGLRAVALRLFNVYGPRQLGGDYAGVITVFNDRLRAGQPLEIYGDGLQTRDFVYVSDVANAVWLALSRPGEGVFNICSGEAATIRQLADVMADLTGRRDVERVFKASRAGDIRHSVGTYARAQEAFGYSPAVKLSQGLGQLMDDQHSVQVGSSGP